MHTVQTIRQTIKMIKIPTKKKAVIYIIRYRGQYEWDFQEFKTVQFWSQDYMHCSRYIMQRIIEARNFNIENFRRPLYNHLVERYKHMCECAVDVHVIQYTRLKCD